MDKLKMKISNIISIVLLIILAFAINQYSISKYANNIDTVNFCNSHYKNNTFTDLFYDREPYVLKTCADKNPSHVYEMHSEYYQNSCPEITDEQLYFSRWCGWIDQDYFLLVLKVFGGFFLPFGFIFIVAYTISNTKNDTKNRRSFN